ncbi:hypothetical protein PDQ70_16460 [Bacillus cereus group sp. Bc011]|uniref:hypothetical protein n=2 Tax=unclassified Bacillus cereus group TaxID=2750818 RepID=UPI0022E84E7B|nr:hypothetical protein [Bacillus cereus group sp. Bc011]MDA2681051.1 hypothetical protein [Bacillus cereus group sp. Bc029]MDA2742051.1 hypothetical protein [Bacillus cereus group sp. Bc011]
MASIFVQKKCFHCGKEKTRGSLGFFIPTMKTYCYEGCDDGFQQENLIPASMSDLVIESIRQHFNEEVQDAIFKTSGKPASLKMSATQSLWFAKYCMQNDIDTVQEGLRSIMNIVMEQENFDDVELTENPFKTVDTFKSTKAEPKKVSQVQEEPEPVKEESVSIVDESEETAATKEENTQKKVDIDLSGLDDFDI